MLNASHEVKPHRLITIGNEGPKIRTTDYWTSELASMGNSFLSWNSGVARLLLPKTFELHLGDMRTADHAVISRGNLPGFGANALEIMFDDKSEAPFCIHLARSHYDQLIAATSSGPTCITVWTEEGKVLSLPAWYRVVRRLPDLSPLKSSEASRLCA